MPCKKFSLKKIKKCPVCWYKKNLRPNTASNFTLKQLFLEELNPAAYTITFLLFLIYIAMVFMYFFLISQHLHLFLTVDYPLTGKILYAKNYVRFKICFEDFVNSNIILLIIVLDCWFCVKFHGNSTLIYWCWIKM